jgi:hypothetical protein
VEEMKSMSEFVSKLEGYADLEVSIIRTTKINKVLKAILKLTAIPKEEEYDFKGRSQNLLDKWNKLLAGEQGTPAAASATNGATAESKSEGEETKGSPAEPTNGTHESSAEKKMDENTEENTEAEEAPVPAAKDEPKVEDAPAATELAEVCSIFLGG